MRRSILTCLLSLAAMVVGAILLEKGLHIQTNEAMLYWGRACLLILADVYELHRKIPMLLYQLAKRNPHRKYREETLFSSDRLAGASNLPGGQWPLWRSC